MSLENGIGNLRFPRKTERELSDKTQKRKSEISIEYEWKHD